MKRIATAALALSLLGGAAALAEPQDWRSGHDHNNGGQNNGQNQGGHDNGGQQHHNPQIYQHFQGAPQNQGGPPNPHNYAPQIYEHHFEGVQNNQPQVYERNVQGPRFPHNNPQVFEQNVQGQRHDRGEWRNFHPEFGAPGFHPGGDRPRYSPEFFPRIFHPEERFHWRGHWERPEGWYYRTWFYGEFLPWGWFGSDWWIADYWWYDLPVPPYGFEWVRNGPDALLVDIRTGMIVEVAPGIFY